LTQPGGDRRKQEGGQKEEKGGRNIEKKVQEKPPTTLARLTQENWAPKSKRNRHGQSRITMEKSPTYIDQSWRGGGGLVGASGQSAREKGVLMMVTIKGPTKNRFRTKTDQGSREGTLSNIRN